MRVLFAVHHQLDERLGAPGASLAVGAALSRLGHEVEFHGYDQAYPGRTRFTARDQLGYPWRLASFLRRNARRFDVVDATTGDGYVWARTLGRVQRAPALVTRSNGLEHLASQALTEEARLGRLKLSWKYPLYNGGFRLWEVRQSLRCANGVVFLSELERDFAIETFGLDADRVDVIPHGIRDVFLNAEPANHESSVDEPIRLCFIGTWIDRKGISTLVEVIETLVRAERPFDLLIAGTGRPEQDVLRDFSVRAAAQVTVVPQYSAPELADLLIDRELLLFPSQFEGFGIAIMEAMACGLAPIATPVGLVPSTLSDGVNGLIVPHHRPDLISAAVERLAGDRSELARLRTAARETAKAHTWEATARKTVALYERARHLRSTGPSR